MKQGEFEQGEIVPGTRYRVLSLLGVGGMGSVYEVEHVELGKRFVLKALLRDLAVREDLVLRQRNEQRALGRLEHPNIVAVTDAGVTSSNVPFFVMERLEGETLAARLRRTQRLGVPEALRIAAGVLEGLAAAHEIGIVHRDVKPPNIFLAAGTRPKLLDFGVAKVTAQGQVITARGVAVGTPRYMSPEQARGESVDGRADLYAVGLVLFEMIVGKGPFDELRDANELLLAHLGRRPPPLGSLATGVTRELEAFVAMLLAKDPRERSPNARACVAALQAVLRRYDSGALSGATPQLSYSQTTERLGVGVPPRTPLGGRDPGTTPPADEATTRDPTTNAVTLRDPMTNAVTVPDGGATLADGPVPSSRTEILFPELPPPAADLATHTRVPVTPTNSSLTLEPVPVTSRSLGARSRWASLAALLALALVGGVLAFAARLGNPRTSASPVPSAALAAEPSAAVIAPSAAPSAIAAGAPSAAPSAIAAGAPSAAPARPSLPSGGDLQNPRKIPAFPGASSPRAAPATPRASSAPGGLPGSGL